MTTSALRTHLRARARARTRARIRAAALLALAQQPADQTEIEAIRAELAEAGLL